ncbi:hypothetical protein CCH79_00016140 [Gambusia affinis]|uniref:DUF4585 domain-containing protein n=1 Tax=Gambusia affinis TaxID=33528 RepID=A0A315VM48_GAMAF|nr:hypothetical protein CCH79_00016140 [Gambusia affinis]
MTILLLLVISSVASSEVAHYHHRLIHPSSNSPGPINISSGVTAGDNTNVDKRESVLLTHWRRASKLHVGVDRPVLNPETPESEPAAAGTWTIGCIVIVIFYLDLEPDSAGKTMSVLEGGRGERKDLAAHGCAEADLPPRHSSSPPSLPPCSLVPADKRSEVTWTGESEVEYLDIFSRDDEEEDESSVWSEEDLSLHFSPSVILQSDDEELEPDSGLECMHATMETQIQVKLLELLQNRSDEPDLQSCCFVEVMMKDDPPERGGVPEKHTRPLSFLRQNSMPASLHTHPTASGEAGNYMFYKGRIAGANSGLLLEGSRRCLQKSYSLDESKTKMASSLLMNILSKKMQVEQSSSTANSLKKLEAAPAPHAPPAPPAGQQGEQQGETGAFKAPLHLVRDVKSFHSISKAVSMNPTSCNAIGQEESVSRHPAAEDHQFRPCSTQSQRSTRCEASPFAPIQLLHPCFYRLQSHLRSVPFIHPPLSCMPSHLHPPAPPPLHLLVKPDKNPIKVRDNSSNQTEISRDSDCRSFGRREQVQPPQQPLPVSSQTFTPGQVCKDLVSTAAPGALLSVPASCHLMLDASSHRCFYMDAGPAAQRKLLLDPETGRFVQVFLPAGSALPMLGGNPTVLPVIQFPLMGVPLLYGGPYLPVTMTTPHDDVTMILHQT